MQMMPRSRHPGQILVLFAVSLTVLLTLAALSLDVGNIYLQYRVAQNAADAAALAGGRCLLLQGTNPSSSERCRPYDAAYSPSTATNALDAKDGIEYWTWKNSYGVTSVVETMQWVGVDDSLTTITASNNLAATSPSTANGVRVTVTRTFSPYLLQAVLEIVDLPSTIATNDGRFIARATATARLGLETIDMDLAPFAACGDYMFEDPGPPYPVPDYEDIVGPAPSYTVPSDPSYIDDEEFILQSSKMAQSQPDATCPGGANWKGKTVDGNDGDNDPPIPVGSTAAVDLAGGNSAADAATACSNAGQPAPGSGCKLLIPIVDKDAKILTLACFKISAGPGGGTEKWKGKLMARDQCPAPTYEYSWSKSTTSAARLMLTQ
jgi:Flp pilus assembly protein TadG